MACGLDGESRSSRATWLIGAAIVAAAALACTPGPAMAMTCGNERLREEDRSTALPDCRSYELVTPPFKGGQPALNALALAPSGDAIAFYDIGGFGEAKDSSELEGTAYVAHREATGWASVAVAPSATEFRGGFGQTEFVNGRENLDFSADLSKTVFFQAPISAATAFAVGAYTMATTQGAGAEEVGPLIEPAKAAEFDESSFSTGTPLVGYAGASIDLSRIVFSIFDQGTTNWLWPGTETVEREALRVRWDR